MEALYKCTYILIEQYDQLLSSFMLLKLRSLAVLGNNPLHCLSEIYFRRTESSFKVLTYIITASSCHNRIHVYSTVAKNTHPRSN